jgi:5-methylthioadenosine/S-adenosylhomocysteine deaminase
VTDLQADDIHAVPMPAAMRAECRLGMPIAPPALPASIGSVPSLLEHPNPSPSSTGRPRPCDLLISAGLLVAGDGSIIEDGAIAVVGREIAAVGLSAELAAEWRAASSLAADGGVVLPGLVNTHNHSPLVLVRGIAEDLGFAPAYTPRIPQGYVLAAEEALALSCLGLWELLRSGSTSVADHYRFPDALARAAELLGLRAFIGGRIHDADMAAIANGDWRHDDAIGAESLNETLDFVESWHGREPRIAPLLCPHAADTCTRRLLGRLGDVARDLDLPVHVHLAQSTAEVDRVRDRDGCSPTELLHEAGLLGPRTVAAHCIHLSPADTALLGRSGATVAHIPVGNAAHGAIAPIAELAESGARITLATDTKSGDMLEAMRMALAAARIRARDTVLDAREVFRWATRNGADALGIGDRCGTLAVGAMADIIVLDARAPNLHPVLCPIGSVVHNGTGSNVRHVVVDGEIVVRDGRSTRADDDALRRDCQAVAARLWDKAGLPLPVDPRCI